jgi:hypothetical protein
LLYRFGLWKIRCVIMLGLTVGNNVSLLMFLSVLSFTGNIIWYFIFRCVRVCDTLYCESVIVP